MKPGYSYSERGMKFFPDITEGVILCVSAVMQIACWKNWAFHMISKNGSFYRFIETELHNCVVT
jgi:hypothetical protein